MLPDVVHDTKRIILDTIGCGVGGYSLDKGKIVAELVRGLGGKPEATVFATGDKVSSANAAFANAELANALDADENLLNFTHFAAAIVANALAVGESTKATGKDLIAAVALGFDIAARIGLSLVFWQVVGQPPDEKVKLTENIGFGWASFGGAAAAGKIMRLGKEEMANALGIAGASASSPSLRKLTSSPSLSMNKYAGYGFIAHTGAMAALLAGKGYRGDCTILDGEFGFWKFYGSLAVDYDIMMNGLGRKWWISETSEPLAKRDVGRIF